MLSRAPLGVTMIKHQWDGEPHWSDVKSDMLTPSWGAPLTERVNQSWWKVQLPVARWSFEKKRHSLFNYCFFFSKMKRKRVLKSSRDVMFRICGCLVNLANSFEMKLMGCLSTAAHHSFRKTTFGILAYQRDVQTFCEKGKPDNRSYSCSRPHIKIFQDSFFFCLTWAMPPTNLVFTTTLSSSVLSNAAFWAAFTRLSEARFTALPAAFKHIISKLACTESTCTQLPWVNLKKNKFLCYLQSPHGFRILVSLHLAGHQQLSRGGRDLFSRGDELLLAGVALHWGVSCLTQVTGGCRYHTSLQQATHGLDGFTFPFNPG